MNFARKVFIRYFAIPIALLFTCGCGTTNQKAPATNVVIPVTPTPQTISHSSCSGFSMELPVEFERQTGQGRDFVFKRKAHDNFRFYLMGYFPRSGALAEMDAAAL